MVKGRPRKLKIFVCHAHEDIEKVQEICDYLVENKFDVWLAEERLIVGHNWKEETLKAERDSDAILICLSRISVEKSGFVQHEIKEALDIAKEKPPGTIFVLPVKLDECNIPLLLKEIHWTNWFSDNGHAQLLRSLQERGKQIGVLPRNTTSNNVEKTSLPTEKEMGDRIDSHLLQKKESGLEAPVILLDKALPSKKVTRRETDANEGGLLAVVLIITAFIVFGVITKFFSFIFVPGNNLAPTSIIELSPIIEGATPTASETSTVLLQKIVDPKGVSMVLIPAGKYVIGSENNNDEKPIHSILLDNYYIDQYEVTNALYASCVLSGICSEPIYSNSSTRTFYYQNKQYDQYPVIFVTWQMAKNYCETWRGGRVPTEAEWEVAAKGANDSNFPWGNNINCNFANYDEDGKTCIGDTAQVGSYENGQSMFSVYEMSGNVNEWVNDWYDQNYYSILSFDELNPLGPSSGEYKVIRGGSWQDSAYALRSSNRNWFDPLRANDQIGFRCVSSP